MFFFAFLIFLPLLAFLPLQFWFLAGIYRLYQFWILYFLYCGSSLLPPPVVCLSLCVPHHCAVAVFFPSFIHCYLSPYQALLVLCNSLFLPTFYFVFSGLLSMPCCLKRHSFLKLFVALLRYLYTFILFVTTFWLHFLYFSFLINDNLIFWSFRISIIYQHAFRQCLALNIWPLIS